MAASAANMQQLLEMGIPEGRARAALIRAKDDVMAAAERVFAGEFDDIPSDDEGDAGPSAPAPKSQSPVSASANRVAKSVVINSAHSDQDMDEEDSGSEAIPSEDEDVDGVEIYDGFADSDDEGGEKLRSDPYAGVFFSKDRSEKIIESKAKPVFVNVPKPLGVAAEGAVTRRAEKVSVRILGSGEWMSGCPEAGEQSHLFQLYDKLAHDAVPCAHQCGYEFHRKPQDFFAVFPDFPMYLAHVASIVSAICPSCAQITCLACGGRSNHVAPGQAFWAAALASGAETEEGEKGKGKGKGKARGDGEGAGIEVESLLHCSDLQGAILGVGLHMIEESFSEKKSQSSNSTTETPPAKRRRKSGILAAAQAQAQAQSDQDEDDDIEVDDYADGVGLGVGGKGGRRLAAGTGYSGAASEDRTGQIKAQKAQIETDKQTSLLLSQVQVYLPHPNRASGLKSSDHLVHPTALAHLRRRSGFVGDLLRNDSLLDMSNRGELYRSLFDWLEVVSSHEALASMLAMPQMRPVASEPTPHPETVTTTYEGSPSPRELLEYIVIQARAALKGLSATSGVEAEATKEVGEDELRMSVSERKKQQEEKRREMMGDENEMLLVFCNRIIASAATIDRSIVETKGKDFVTRMQASLPKLPGKEDEAGDRVVAESGATGEAIIKIYEEWAMKTRFQYADLTNPASTSTDGVTYRHAYNAQIVALESQSAPKRSLAIAKELAILTTSLPVAWHSTIFLRVDESRVDCIKAMIVGPEGTPYENGCFIFDIFLPLQYNQSCPVVKSMTTYGGRYRYNPNLYADGKVCLSLLGTWQGPGWIAGQSTLLQVLISIQSLIMCEEPYCNEPAWANDAGTPQAKAYDANVRRMVLVDAMAGNIKNPPYPFENEIRTHFRLKAPSIRLQLEKWAKMDDGRKTKGDPGEPAEAIAIAEAVKMTPFNHAAEALKVLLGKLEKGEEI